MGKLFLISPSGTDCKVYFPVHGYLGSRDVGVVDVFDCVKECMRFLMYLII